MLYKISESMEEILKNEGNKIFDIGDSKIADIKSNDFIEHFKMSSIMKKGITGIPSGFRDLDNVMGGFQNGSFIIIAGRPGMGKTSLAINIALNSALIYAKRIAIFELEVSAKNLISRMASMLSKVEIEKVMKNSFDSKEEQDKVSEVIKKLKQVPIYIDETPLLTFTDIRAKIRELKKKGVDMIIIDYLQLIEDENSNTNRAQQLSKILQSLKMLTEELNITVIALSQIDREIENRENKRPTLADLSKISGVEQYADIVMLLYRDEVYSKNTKEKGIVEINIINKGKHFGTAKLEFESKTMSFMDLSN